MYLKLLCVGQKMPDWVQTGYDDYAKRMSGGQCRLQLKELAPAKRTKQGVVSRYLDEEAERIEQNLTDQPIRIVLDERGDLVTTKQLSQKLAQWLPSGRDVVFVVGGPDGLRDDVKQKADWLWSLSPLTLPHPMVRIVLAEQLYRAWSLLNNHPYHRE
jgi:23S rRNA (pseudouridine1915-N3)-methyltransferase